MCDQADPWIEAERAEGVRRIQTTVQIEGAADCEVCGDGIAAERRGALPSARTCHLCQSAAEQRARLFRR